MTADPVRWCRNGLHKLSGPGRCEACWDARRQRNERTRKRRTMPQWERQRLAGKRAYDDGSDATVTLRVLELDDELRRNPMPWRRAEIVAEIARIRRAADLRDGRQRVQRSPCGVTPYHAADLDTADLRGSYNQGTVSPEEPTAAVTDRARKGPALGFAGGVGGSGRRVAQ